MVVGTLVWRKRFSAAQYAAAGVMITGLVTVRAIVHANAAACGRTAATAHQALAQLDVWMQFAWVGTGTVGLWSPRAQAPVVLVLRTRTRMRCDVVCSCVTTTPSAGAFQFILADAAVTPNFQPLGVVLVAGALFADAFVGNTQESLFA